MPNMQSSIYRDNALAEEEDYVTLSQAAKILGIAYGTAHRWVREGRFSQVYRTKLSRRIYLPVAELQTLLSGQNKEERRHA